MKSLTTDGAATRLHVVEDDGTWVVWLDTDIGIADGICVGLGADCDAAIQDAISELRDRLADLEHRA